jgi:hypothetical protein
MAFRRSTVRFRSAPLLRLGSLRMVHALRLILICVCLGGDLLFAAGCSSRQRDTVAIDEPAGIERPARPLTEEESFADRVGQVGVVILVIGATVGAILLPILLL